MSNIPDYMEFVLPFLQILNDGEIHTIDEIIIDLVISFRLSESDKNELVKCGRQYKYKNRIISARTFLIRAEFVQYNGKQNIFITDKGKEFLMGFN